jgi:hypothetical protein
LPKESEKNRPNIYKYFYYKLFDNNGEDVLDSETSYKNISKVILFNEDESEKKKYEVMNEIETHSVKIMDTEDSTHIKSENAQVNCFGPQKSKRSIAERNFRPY